MSNFWLRFFDCDFTRSNFDYFSLAVPLVDLPSLIAVRALRFGDLEARVLF